MHTFHNLLTIRCKRQLCRLMACIKKNFQDNYNRLTSSEVLAICYLLYNYWINFFLNIIAFTSFFYVYNYHCKLSTCVPHEILLYYMFLIILLYYGYKQPLLRAQIYNKLSIIYKFIFYQYYIIIYIFITLSLYLLNYMLMTYLD